MNQGKIIFKRGSTTFFMSSLFFPSAVKKDVFDLYSFVRTADDYVDQVPADNEGFHRLRQLWEEAVANPDFSTTPNETDSIDETVTKNMLRVVRKNKFDLAWVEAFLDSMQADLSHKPCQTIRETLGYVYGSGEVIGLMMASIMELKDEAAETAKLQGRALQFLNFIRDIQEDVKLSRNYFPAEDLRKFNLPDLTRRTALTQPKDFTEFMHFQLGRYEIWQDKASDGYKYIPRRLRIPVQTAADLYGWTAQEIRKDPLTVYTRAIKPSRPHVLWRVFINTLTPIKY